MAMPGKRKSAEKVRRGHSFIHNVNTKITALMKTTKEYKLGATVLINEHDLILTVIYFNFPTSSVGYLKVQVRYNGQLILPYTKIMDIKKMKADGIAITDYIESSDIPSIEYINLKLRKGDRLEVWYQNSHTQTNLTFQTEFEIERIEE